MKMDGAVEIVINFLPKKVCLKQTKPPFRGLCLFSMFANLQ